MDITTIFNSFVSLLPRDLIGTVSDILEIIIIAFLIYGTIMWVRNTKAWVLLQGILLILGGLLIASILKFDVILWIAGKVATIAVMALIIIFQQELRIGIAELGRRLENNKISRMLGISKTIIVSDIENTIEEIVKAVYEMAPVKTGALIVIERKEPLNDIIKTGISIDAKISAQLLINIFEHNTPLHDGAVVIKNNRIEAATCYLPLSTKDEISKEFGTRHRAAVGVSEQTDSVTVTVSEETGRVSIAFAGELKRIKNEEQLRKLLHEYINTESEVSTKKLKLFRTGRAEQNEKNID